VTEAGDWVAVAAAGDLPPGASLAARAGAAEVAVFNVDGELRAVEGRCLHRGGSLAEGMVDGGVVVCPRHWWRYDLRTGERQGDRRLRLSCYPVRVRDGRVEVMIPAARAELPWRERLLAAGRDWTRARGAEGP
jgi:nitrite reductase/ring-hydroxylating ferredoxin subunit